MGDKKRSWKPWHERLRDPRWQKKRLEALEAAGWECESCGTKEVELHVHHRYYAKGREPWDYDAGSLSVLCKDGHADEHRLRDQLGLILAGFGIADIEHLAGYATAYACAQCDDRNFEIGGYEWAWGFGSFYGVEAETVLGAIDLQGHAGKRALSAAELSYLETSFAEARQAVAG